MRRLLRGNATRSQKRCCQYLLPCFESNENDIWLASNEGESTFAVVNPSIDFDFQLTFDSQSKELQVLGHSTLDGFPSYEVFARYNGGPWQIIYFWDSNAQCFVGNTWLGSNGACCFLSPWLAADVRDLADYVSHALLAATIPK